MKWEIVGKKVGDRKDTTFYIEATTSAEAVSEAMSWGWTVKSFHQVGAEKTAGFSTLLLGVISVVVIAAIGGGSVLILQQRETASPTKPAPAIAPQRLAAEPVAPQSPVAKTAAPTVPPPAPTATAAPAPVASAHPSPAAEGSAMFENLPGKPELLVAAAEPAGVAPATSPARALTPALVTAAQVKYVASKAAGPFHLPTCTSAQRISTANLQTFESREAAIAAGHEPCKVCKP
jgi:micrococcal nuclease